MENAHFSLQLGDRIVTHHIYFYNTPSISLQVSEGLDFADENGRAVIITGLPYPNVKVGQQTWQLLRFGGQIAVPLN